MYRSRYSHCKSSSQLTHKMPRVLFQPAIGSRQDFRVWPQWTSSTVLAPESQRPGPRGKGGQKMVEIILMPSCAGCGYTMLNPQFSHRDSAKLLLQDPQKCGRSKPGHQTTNVSENRLPLIPLIYHDSSLFMIVPIWTWPLGGYNPYFQTHTPWWLSPWRRCKVRISECQQPGAPTQTTQPNIDMAPDAEF